jgi:hypothetical protein
MICSRWYIVTLSCGCTFVNSQDLPRGIERWCQECHSFERVESCDPYEVGEV